MISHRTTVPYRTVNVQRENNADDVMVSEVCLCLLFPLLTVPPSHYCGLCKKKKRHCTLPTDIDACLEVSVSSSTS